MLKSTSNSRLVPLYLVAALYLYSACPATADSVFIRGLSVNEHQPTLPFSGRVNAVAINPRFPQIQVLVATESGGLFESRTQGSTWRHVDALPVMNLRDVHFFPADPRVILVTAQADELPDFQNLIAIGPTGSVTTSGGGIWISRDNGTTWSHPDSAVPRANIVFPATDRSCPPNLSAYGASIDDESGRVFVATDCGVLYSDDLGVSWTLRSIRSGLNFQNRRFLTVAALDGPGVVLGGISGVWYSNDNGDTWNAETTGIGFVLDSHAAGHVPGRTGVGYIVTSDSPGNRTLWRTRDNGQTWSSIASAPPNRPSCGGIAHIRAFPNPLASGWLGSPVEELYYGNACETFYHPASGLSLLFLSFPWTKLEASHADTRTIGFWPGTNNPVFIGSDGGLDRSPNGRRWTPIGSGPDKINALQLYDVEGQQIRDAGQYHLAIGTHDNSLWASADDGLTWPTIQQATAEGGNIQMRRSIGRDESDKWTYYACWPCARSISDPLFLNQQGWAGNITRPGCGFGGTGKIGSLPAFDGQYIHSVFPNDPPTPTSPVCDVANTGLELTLDFGASYGRIWNVPSGETLQGGPSVTRLAIVYNGIKRGTRSVSGFDDTWATNDTELVRMIPGFGGPLKVSYPAMNDFGSLGYYGFQFQWPAIFGVNPRDPSHIIAPDVENDLMMFTIDGGEKWTEIVGLTNQITRMGDLNFSRANRRFTDVVFSLVSAIRFFPENPELVVLGLHQGGAYISGDRGRVWSFVPGSERINNITDFHWKSANEIYVASFGRGLWKIEYRLFLDIADLLPALSGQVSESAFVNEIDFGGGLFLDLIAPGPSQTISLLEAITKQQLVDTVAIAVNGQLDLSGRNTKQLDKQVPVSPGASLLTFVPEIDETLTDSVENLDLDSSVVIAKQDDFVPVGVGFSNGKVVGIVFGQGVVYKPPSKEPVEFQPAEPENPPRFDGGYFTLAPAGSAFTGGIAYSANDVLTAEGHAFKSMSAVEVLIDGKVITETTVDAEGGFKIDIPLKDLSVGAHEVLMQQIDSTDSHLQTIFITPQDLISEQGAVPK